MNKTRWIPALTLGLLIACIVRESLTPFILMGKTYAGRSYLVQLLLLMAYAFFFSVVLVLFFPKGMQWLGEKYDKIRLPALSAAYPRDDLASLNWLDWVMAILTGLASLVLYIRTLTPGLQYGDSGEFQTLTYTLGTTHPTGYQVYILLARLFTLLPIGELAYRVNLFSAFLGALTVSQMYLIIRMIVYHRLAAVISSIAMALSPLFWFFSVNAECYIPASAFICAVVLSLLLWRRSGKDYWLTVSGLLGGLSLGLHLSSGLIAPGVLVYILFSKKQTLKETDKHNKINPWLAAAAGALLGVGLMVLSFLIVDANNVKADYFHAVVEPNTSYFRLTESNLNTPLKRFVWQFSGQQFGSPIFSGLSSTIPSRLAIFRELAVAIFPPFFLVLIFTGMFALWFQKKSEGWLVFIGWLVTMIVMINYSNIDLSILVFYFPVILYIWLGVGVGALIKGLSYIARRVFSDREAILSSAFLGIIIIGGILQHYQSDIRDSWAQKSVSFIYGSVFSNYAFSFGISDAVYSQASRLVDAVENDAIVFASWNLLFPSYFIAHVERGLKDIDFHETILTRKDPHDLYESTADYIKDSVDKRPVYFYGECPRGPLIAQFETKLSNREGVALCEIIGFKN